MIQSYDQIKQQANEINSDLSDVVYIQKIYSSSYFISLGLRYKGQTKHLYIGRGSGYEGLWLSQRRVEPTLRQIDKFLEYVRKHLGSSSLRRIDIDTDDRIVRIKYFKWGRDNYFYLFYKARKLYFANTYYDCKNEMNYVFKSWTNKKTIFDQESYEMFNEIGRINLENKTSSTETILKVETLLAQELKKANVKSVEGKTKKFLKRKQKNIIVDLEEVRNWPKLLELIDKESDFTKYDRVTVYEKIKVKFKTKDHYHRRDEIYLKIKKFKKAITILELRLKDTEDKLISFGKDQVSKSTLPVISPGWNIQKEKITEQQDSTLDYKTLSFDGYRIGIGNTAKGNDQLRKTWAKKDDIWFHLEGDKSPHIVLKREGNLEQEVLSVIAGVMIAHSKLNYTEVNLIYTQVKNLKGIKGVPGSVIFKKEKHIRIYCNMDWENLLI